MHRIYYRSSYDGLDAAGTKWNFLKFKPGLVGGHCIGVDPYYLVHKAQSLGYFPQVISSGRLVNDGMGMFIAKKILKRLIANGLQIQHCNVLILGFTLFLGFVAGVQAEYAIGLVNEIDDVQYYDAVIRAVAHRQFQAPDINRLKKDSRFQPFSAFRSPLFVGNY